MRRHRLLLLAVVVTGIGCADAPTAPDGLEKISTDVSATRVTGGILLTNGTRDDVAYLAFNPQALVQWAQCGDPGPECLRLPAGSSLTIRDRDIELYAEGMPEAAVLFWRVLSDPRGGYRIEDIKEVMVPLR